MTLEILGSRILGPLFGTGLYAWASPISVALMGLSLGYWGGGRWIDRRPRQSTIAYCIVACAAWVVAMTFFRGPVLMWASELGLAEGALCAAGILLGPAFVGLGMVCPAAIRLVAQEESPTGSRSGALPAASTVGSVAGTLGTAFRLIPTLSLTAGPGVGGRASGRTRGPQGAPRVGSRAGGVRVTVHGV